MNDEGEKYPEQLFHIRMYRNIRTKRGIIDSFLEVKVQAFSVQVAEEAIKQQYYGWEIETIVPQK